MTVAECAAALRERLLAAGLDLRRPDPLLSWLVFKEFTAALGEGRGEWLGVEVGDYSLDFVLAAMSSTLTGTYCRPPMGAVTLVPLASVSPPLSAPRGG